MLKIEPHPSLLSEIIDPHLETLLKKYSEGLKNSVHFGTQLLAWDIQESTGGIENFPVWMLSRHIIEILDSTIILIEKSSIDPCKPLLRAALESMLNLEFLLDDNYEQRAKAFIICNYFERLNDNRRLLKGTPEFDQLKTSLAKDKTSPMSFTNLDLSEISNEITQIQEVIDHHEYKSVKEEYLSLKNKTKKTPKWYQLFNGPKNLEQMANNLGRNGLYEIFYRSWSGPTHGTDVLNHWVFDQNNRMEIIALRYGKDAQLVASCTSTLITILFEILRRKRIRNHDDEFIKWFENYIPFFNELHEGTHIKIKFE